jgi:Fic family protein
MSGAIQYVKPDSWLIYDQSQIFNELTEAKAQILALQAIPYQRRWVDELQRIQLKMEIAGTSQIEGADFSGNELDQALRAQTPEELSTRSQRQANSAIRAYKWIADLPSDIPIDEDLICKVHRLIVTDCDDDHCEPGHIRRADQNVTFGIPVHRGVVGGLECADAFARLAKELRSTFSLHDPLIQALALHYHFASMHPFWDGDGRTARALEALMLRRSGLKDTLFIAMSNYYYEEKREYLDTLSKVRAGAHDLTPFLKFGLKGIAIQTGRLSGLIRHEVSKQIFRNLMHDLFVRLESTRKRVIVRRQLELLETLLSLDDAIEFVALSGLIRDKYKTRKDPLLAISRDLNRLGALGSVTIDVRSEGKRRLYFISVNLDWPMQITETEFFAKIEKLPKSKTHSFFASAS